MKVLCVIYANKGPRVVCTIIITNVITKFHEDWTINVTHRVLTSKTVPPPGGHTNDMTKKNATPPSGHVFQRTGTILELSRDIITTHVITTFHEDWTTHKTSRVLTSFKLDQNIIGTNLLTKFHEDQTINKASRQNVEDRRRTTDKR
ncbi:hypothetical protein DPMN_138080 [Dreissena polymorpha]|uniref:Uncharacterized protein n=1 Tax=Dreissena polymorpha TaxID=45954 RepID=A0A9D4JGY7_DREPO|nr:hypothetical protein DPMN_138080 [Dreissena polymorpha]